jgi:hypothetical protein
MDRHTHTVSEALTGRLTTADGRAEVRARLIYEARDPYAITITIKDPAGVVQIWTVGRELLRSGLTAQVASPAGLDRIRLWTCVNSNGPVLMIALMSSFFAVLELRLPGVSAFLANTLDLVQPGDETEHVDLDTELIQLLG